MYTLSQGLKKFLKEKRTNTKEITVEEHLVAQVESNKGLAIKIRLIRGFPDRMILWPGGVVHFVEVKRPKGGRFEPLQLYWHKILKDMGFTVLVLDNKNKVARYVKEYCHGIS